jgi:arginine-tRNA-protein transferase
MEANKIQQAEMNIFHTSINDTAQSCGYCKEEGLKKKTSYKWGFSSKNMPADLYGNLMFLGWRRCGDYYYKNDLNKSCCKLYSMRLDVDKFKINKNQKKVMKNFRKFLIGQPLKENKIETNDFEMIDCSTVDPYNEDITKLLYEFKNDNGFLDFLSKFKLSEFNFKVFFNKQNKFGDYSTNLFIVLFQALKNNPDFKADFQNPKDFYKAIFKVAETFFQKEVDKYKISLSENTGHLNFFIVNEEFQKFREIKLKNENKPKKIKQAKKEEKLNENEHEYKLPYFEETVTTPLIAEENLKHKYTIELEPNSKFTNEKFEVYKKYQKVIHKDKDKELTKDRYIQSWGNSDLTSSKKFETNNPLHPKQYGTYDLIHRIDGKVVAVGILDILPTSISSVYLYYDPEYSFLDLGILTAVREIEFLKHLKKELDDSFKYYVMGFYCYTCQKMKYKGSYHPSEILCPITNNFVDLDSNLDKVKENKIQQLSTEPKNKGLTISKIEIVQLIKTLKLDYQGTEFDFMTFITNYIDKKYKTMLVSIVEHLIETMGKDNFMKFKLVAG